MTCEYCGRGDSDDVRYDAVCDVIDYLEGDYLPAPPGRADDQRAFLDMLVGQIRMRFL